VVPVSGLVDVGDAIELVFTTVPGATVVMDWLDPDQSPVLTDETITESPASSGQYPTTLLPTAAGTWTALFTASGTTAQVEAYYVRANTVTGPPPFATLGEYTALYGGLSDAKATTARALLKRASQLIRDSYPGIDTRTEAGTVPADSVGLVVLNMTARVMRNPNGLRSETTGPFSRSYDPDAASGLLQITATDVGLLLPPVTAGARGRFGTIRVTGGMVPCSPDSSTDLLFGPGC
jgi:hypothetical protein